MGQRTGPHADAPSPPVLTWPLPGVETPLSSYKPAPPPPTARTPKEEKARSEKPFLLTVIALTWGAEDLKTGNHLGWGFVASHIHPGAHACTRAAHIRSPRGLCGDARWKPKDKTSCAKTVAPRTRTSNRGGGGSQRPGEEKGRVTRGPSHLTPEGPKAALRPRRSGSEMWSAPAWSGRISA